jgi:hypothetical protein
MAEIFLTGIPSAEIFGGVTNIAQEIQLSPILSEEAFGEVRGNTNVDLTGIPTSEAFGTVGYYHTIDLRGIVSREGFGNLTGEVGFMPPDIPIVFSPLSLSLSERFSSPVIDVATVPDGDLPVDSYDPDQWNIFQDFFLPDDFSRGDNTSDPHGAPVTMQKKIPPLTGIQLLTDIATGYEDVAALDWTVQYLDSSDQWVTLQSGSAVGANASGPQVWFSIYFPTPIVITEDLLNQRFRFALRGRDYTEVFKEEIPDNQPLVINNTEYQVYLLPGSHQELLVDGVPSVLHRDANTERIYYSQEYGITGLWFTYPNPLAPDDTGAYITVTTTSGTLGTGLLGEGTLGVDGDVTDTGSSLNFRLLAGIADEGVDFLGNSYRNVITYTSPDNANVTDSANNDAFWLSKPNPSQFAVESLYFDVSKENDQTTIDHILMDPSTPGVWFNVYYSSEGEPGRNPREWANKLWTPVDAVFQAQQRLTHPLPSPITGKYIKIEFTKLQPRWYSPGNFQKDVLYDKFPKWVLDYYLITLEAGSVSPNTEDPFIPRSLTVSTDAFALAYTYYLDDLRDQPQTPRELIPSVSDLNTFLQQRGSQSDQIDSSTLIRIKTAFRPFETKPGVRGAIDQLLSLYTGGAGGSVKSDGQKIRPDYPTELAYDFPQNTTFVSSLQRDQLVSEATMPVMKFFIPARHRYRLVKASLPNDKAYFAGVNNIAFLRNDYSVPFDDPMMVEMAGDNANLERNDFVWTPDALVVSND